MKKGLVLGMPALIECSDIRDAVKACKKLALDFIELNMNLPQYQINKIDKKVLKKLKNEEGIFFTMHLDENMNVCDFNESVASAYVDTAIQAIRLAKELDMPVLNMHMATGVHFTLPDKKVYLFNEYKDEYIRGLKKFRDTCAAEIGSGNIKICIENTDGYEDFIQEGINVLLESNAFALTWDVGHDYCSNNHDADFILSNRERLVHMHLHDAKGTKNHMILGTGEVNLAEKLEIARDNGCRCVIETKTVEALEKSVEYLRGAEDNL